MWDIHVTYANIVKNSMASWGAFAVLCVLCFHGILEETTVYLYLLAIWLSPNKWARHNIQTYVCTYIYIYIYTYL